MLLDINVKKTMSNINETVIRYLTVPIHVICNIRENIYNILYHEVTYVCLLLLCVAQHFVYMGFGALRVLEKPIETFAQNVQSVLDCNTTHPYFKTLNVMCPQLMFHLE